MRKILLICLFIVFSASGLMAEQPFGKCSNQVLRGIYAISSSGWGPDLYQTPDKLVYFTSVAQVTYDGNGKGEGFIVANIGGVAMRATLSENYNVNPDCTVNDELTADAVLPPGFPPIQFKNWQFLIMNPDGTEGVAMAVTPDLTNPMLPAPQIVSSTIRRISRH